MNTVAYDVKLPQQFTIREAKKGPKYCAKCRIFVRDKELSGVIGIGEVCPSCLHMIQSAMAAGTGKLETIPKVYEEAVAAMLKKLSNNSNCRTCYGRGYVGYDYQGLPVVCHRCVHGGTALAWWREFVNLNEPLHRLFPWLVGDIIEESQSRLKPAVQPAEASGTIDGSGTSAITMQDIDAARQYLRELGE